VRVALKGEIKIFNIGIWENIQYVGSGYSGHWEIIEEIDSREY
jgi:hypothetical protein